MITRRILVLSALSVLAGYHATAFTPASLQTNRFTQKRLSLATDADSAIDVSIPYDAAARLEYDKWRSNFDKGDFDEDKFTAFKVNYEMITVANVVAAKEARETGSSPKKFTLNQFADMTEEAYTAMMAEKDAPSADSDSNEEKSESVDIMNASLNVASSQNEASAALEEASAALDEEEQVSLYTSNSMDASNNLYLLNT